MRAGTSTSRRTSAGFTLMELAVVILVLSLAALVVIPRLPDTAAGELRSSARKFAATLRYLSDLAITGKSPYRLRLAPGTGTASVRAVLASGEEADSGDPFLQRQLLPPGVVVADVVNQPGGKRSDGEVILDFGPGGIDRYAAVHLKGKDGAFYTVTAYPVSGKVVTEEGYREEKP